MVEIGVFGYGTALKEMKCGGRRERMITKNYIKMCEKAKEIQKGHKWKKGDRGYFLGYISCNESMKKNEHFIFGTEEFEDTIESWWTCIYLPTQEQLQEIMLKDYTVRAILGGVFYFAVKRYKDLEKVSMNELWLAFVMKEKYNKIWNGDDWK